MVALSPEGTTLGLQTQSDLVMGTQNPEPTMVCPGWCLAPRTFQGGQRHDSSSQGTRHPAVGGKTTSAF